MKKTKKGDIGLVVKWLKFGMNKQYGFVSAAFLNIVVLKPIKNY